MRRLILPALLLLSTTIAPVLFAQQEDTQPVTPAVVEPAEISIAGVPLPAGTPEEQRAYLAEKLDEKLDTTVIFVDAETQVERKRRDMGVVLDIKRMLEAAAARPAFVPLMLEVDVPVATAALERIRAEFDRSPADAKPYMYRGEFYLRPAVEGRTLIVPATAEQMRRLIVADGTVRQIDVVVERKAPRVTSQALEGIDGLLATFETTTTTNANRNHNVMLAAQKINGTILPAGATFSLNAVVGERTLARGFKAAIVFENARPVEGVGGGVSQVTGTLFNAAALAGLKILEVYPHSRPVAYLPLGRDATVAWRQKDLRFVNNTGAPIYMEYTFENRQLRATLYGKTVEGRRITLSPQVERRGAGRISARLYREIKNGDDKVVRERLLSHTYRWDPST